MDGLLPPKDPTEIAAWVLTPAGMIVATVIIGLLILVEALIAWRRIRMIRERAAMAGAGKSIRAAE